VWIGRAQLTLSLQKAEEEPAAEEEPRVFALHRSAQFPPMESQQAHRTEYLTLSAGPSTRTEYTRNGRPRWPNGIENGSKAPISSHLCPRGILDRKNMAGTRLWPWSFWLGGGLDHLYLYKQVRFFIRWIMHTCTTSWIEAP
jgi:hypothetical protein